MSVECRKRQKPRTVTGEKRIDKGRKMKKEGER